MITSTELVLMIVLVGCVAWGIAAVILMIRFIESRGVKINWIWLRALTLRYVHQYRQISSQETGKVGELFYHFIIAFGLALVVAILLIVKISGLLNYVKLPLTGSGLMC